MKKFITLALIVAALAAAATLNISVKIAPTQAHACVNDSSC